VNIHVYKEEAEELAEEAAFFPLLSLCSNAAINCLKKASAEKFGLYSGIGAVFYDELFFFFSYIFLVHWFFIFILFSLL